VRSKSTKQNGCSKHLLATTIFSCYWYKLIRIVTFDKMKRTKASCDILVLFLELSTLNTLYVIYIQEYHTKLLSFSFYRMLLCGLVYTNSTSPVGTGRFHRKWYNDWRIVCLVNAFLKAIYKSFMFFLLNKHQRKPKEISIMANTETLSFTKLHKGKGFIFLKSVLWLMTKVLSQYVSQNCRCQQMFWTAILFCAFWTNFNRLQGSFSSLAMK
jgi:hypothetical protein